MQPLNKALRRLAGWLVGVAAVLASSVGQAQSPYFNRRYPVPNDTTGAYSSISAITATADSGYITFGNVGRPDRLARLVQLLDVQGNVRRSREYGQAGRAYFAPVFGNGDALAVRGGYMTVGTIRSNGQEGFMLWRFNSQGDTLWTRTYYQAGSTRGQVIYSSCHVGCQLRNGDYALVGEVARSGSGNGTQLLVLRTDSLGGLRWQRQYGQRFRTLGFSVGATADGGLVVGSVVTAYNPSPADPSNSTAVILKLDSAGSVQWADTLVPLAYPLGGGMVRPLRGGGYLATAQGYAGRVGSSQRVVWQPLVFRLDSAGGVVWQRPLGPARVAAGVLIPTELPDGSLILAGGQNDDDPANTSQGVGYRQGWAAKLCPDGDSLWFRTYRLLTASPRSAHILNDFQPTPDGGFVGCGHLFPSPPDLPGTDGWVFRVDSVGNLVANGPAPGRTTCAGVPTGVAAPPAGGGALAEAITLVPNPSSDGYFTLGGASGASCTVHDGVGRLVWQGLIRQATQPLDLSRAPAGLYLLRLTWPAGRIFSRKLLLE